MTVFIEYYNLARNALVIHHRLIGMISNLAMNRPRSSSLLKRPVPDLGGLPLERYVLFQWNRRSLAGLDGSTRRGRLAHEYVKNGDCVRYVSVKWQSTFFVGQLTT
jgi:hypothetical protein